MTLEEAIAKVNRMTDAPVAPIVTAEEVESILAECRIIDAEGRAPVSDGWEGAWDFNLAAAEVLETKAVRCATDFDFSADGSRFNRSQKQEHFRQLARELRNRRACSFEPEFGGHEAEVEVLAD